jgi:Mycolic acid cyclopropane synthetase
MVLYWYVSGVAQLVYSVIAVVVTVHASALAAAALKHCTVKRSSTSSKVCAYYCTAATSHTDVSPLPARHTHYKCTTTTCDTHNEYTTITTAKLTANVLLHTETLTTHVLLQNSETPTTIVLLQTTEKRAQVAAAGLSHLMTFELVDYRVFAKQHPGEFDRIISCEMIEAVGHNYLPSYFAAVERLLAPDGVFVMEVRVHTEPVH